MTVRVGFVGFSGVDVTETDLDVSGGTLDDLLSAVERAHGAALLRAVCHEGHIIDSGVMVLRNDARIDSRDRSQTISEGDRVSFVRMVAGG